MEPGADEGVGLAEPTQEGHSSRRHRILRTLGVLLVITLVFATLYERVFVLRDLEHTARDFQARIRSPWTGSEVVIVQITEADYYDLFGGESPLSPERLTALIDAIARGNPSAIGVDLSTSDSVFRDLAVRDDWPPVVWAREAVRCEELPAERPCVADDRVLLDFADSDRPTALYGLTVAQPDTDGLIRRYRQWMTVEGEPRPTFTTAVRAAAGASTDQDEGGDYFIHYRPWPPGEVLDASFVLRASAAPDFGERGILRDRIVLLGGDYRAARDRYATPLGELAGVEILAQAIQTEIQGHRTEPLSRGLLSVLLIMNGLGLLAVFQILSFPHASAVALVSIPVFATLSSLIVDRSPFSLWPYVVPLLIAILMQQLYMRAIRYRDELIKQASKKLPRRSTKPATD